MALGNDDIPHHTGSTLGTSGNRLHDGPQTASTALELLAANAVPDAIVVAGRAGRVGGAVASAAGRKGHRGANRRGDGLLGRLRLRSSRLDSIDC